MVVRPLVDKRDCPLEMHKIHQQARVKSEDLRPSERDSYMQLPVTGLCTRLSM